MKAPQIEMLFAQPASLNQPQRQQLLAWHWALDGGRVTSVELLLDIALGVIDR